VTPRGGGGSDGNKKGRVETLPFLFPKAYNAKVGLMPCCPVTHQAKGYPFEVDIRSDSHITRVVLSDQVKCLDWQARGIRKKGVASKAELEETLGKLKTLLE